MLALWLLLLRKYWNHQSQTGSEVWARAKATKRTLGLDLWMLQDQFMVIGITLELVNRSEH